MIIILKFSSLLLVAFFCSTVESESYLTRSAMNTVYESMGFVNGKTSEMEWKKSFNAQGCVVADVLDKISFEQNGKIDDPEKKDHKEETEFIMFASLSDNGGSLFSSVPKLIEKGYKKFRIIFMINYFNPDPAAAKACNELLKEIEALASEGAILSIQQFHTSGKGGNEEQENTRRNLEKKAEGCLNNLNGGQYGKTSQIDDITQPEKTILVDGLWSSEVSSFSLDNVIFETPIAAFGALANAANLKSKSGLIVVANNSPSGMTCSGDCLLLGDRFHFRVHVLLSMGWMRYVVCNKALEEAQIYWLFFKMNDPKKSFFETFKEKEESIKYHASQKAILKEMIEMQEKQNFAVVNRKTGKAIPVQL